MLSALSAVAIVGASCGGDDSDSGSAGPSLRPTDAAETTMPATSVTTSVAPSETSAATTSDSTVPPPTTVAVTSPLPAVDVLDVATGETVNFASLIPADRPVLLWFWAPH